MVGGLSWRRLADLLLQYSSDEDTNSCLAIRDLVQELSTRQSPSIFAAGPHRDQLDSRSFETFLREANLTDKAIASAQVWTHAMLGVDPSEVSALYFIECGFCCSFDDVQH